MDNTAAAGTPAAARRPRVAYKWIALSNTTLGILMAMLDTSIVNISLPAIFRGIKLNPLDPANGAYLLWMLMGYLVVTAVFVVTFGRLGDMFGRVRMYNAGFAIFTLGSIALSLVWSTGAAGAMELILLRLFQGVGGALLLANSTAILTDAFPVNERGRAMGINMVAAIAGAFIGLIVGGLLADIHWRLVFWVNVPFGVVGTLWAYLMLKEVGIRTPARIDWLGTLSFGACLVMVLAGITYGIEPRGGHSTGWQSPFVLSLLLGGTALLIAFIWIEQHVDQPMFHLSLFRIRAFTAGNMAGMLSAVGRGGLQFLLIIWLQGIWLPLHGYNFADTPLWAGIYMLPLTGGFLIVGPLSGWLSDRFGARPFATGGMLVTALSFGLMMLLPVNFPFLAFALLTLLNGVGMGLFAAPNTVAIMNSVPPRSRGVTSGMRMTFQNGGMVLSTGIFFSLLIAGLSAALPHAMYAGLVQQGVPAVDATRVANIPPIGSVFAALLGMNPMQQLLGPKVLSALPPDRAQYLTGKTFFPGLISGPFMDGLKVAFAFALVMCLIAAVASALRGGIYLDEETAVVVPGLIASDTAAEVGAE